MTTEHTLHIELTKYTPYLDLTAELEAEHMIIYAKSSIPIWLWITILTEYDCISLQLRHNWLHNPAVGIQFY